MRPRRDFLSTAIAVRVTISERDMADGHHFNNISLGGRGGGVSRFCSFSPLIFSRLRLRLRFRNPFIRVWLGYNGHSPSDPRVRFENFVGLFLIGILLVGVSACSV